MDEISGFWAGAQTVGSRVDLSKMAEAVGGWDALEEGGEDALIAAGLAPKKARQWANTPPRRTRGQAIRLVDRDYPTRLRSLSCAPAVLFLEGDVAALEADAAVSIVGTRCCSAYGAAVARHLAGGLANRGANVVSGLARGIDSHAHWAAVKNGWTTAVLAHGLSHTAPSSSRRLRREIVDNGGVVLSTWPDEIEPRPYQFPIRNRWIAGLADRTVVVEAPRKSGALHTSKAATDFDRLVYAVPGRMGDHNSEGCLWLLHKNEAFILADVEDFVADTCRTKPRAPTEWLEVLFAGKSVDEVARVCGRSTVELLVELTMMELRGEVVRLPGQRYAPGRSLK
jgi:DNA processing protein